MNPTQLSTSRKRYWVGWYSSTAHKSSETDNQQTLFLWWSFISGWSCNSLEGTGWNTACDFHIPSSSVFWFLWCILSHLQVLSGTRSSPCSASFPYLKCSPVHTFYPHWPLYPSNTPSSSCLSFPEKECSVPDFHMAPSCHSSPCWSVACRGDFPECPPLPQLLLSPSKYHWFLLQY